MKSDQPKFAAAELTSLQELTYQKLKDLIQDGSILPGERLFAAQVAKTFNISRSPARHALDLLQRQGLVDEDDKRGYRVAGKGSLATCGSAKLDPFRLSVPRQWELMRDEVDQELLYWMLLGSVRINEKRLAEHFDVSRTVTRDLLARMHGVGMISKGAAGHWEAEQVTPERIRHLFELRAILEPEALLLSAPHTPREQLVQAKNNLTSALGQSQIDSALFDLVENDMHVVMLSYCPNQEILNSLKRTHFLFGPTRYRFLSNEPKHKALVEHAAVIDHLIEGDAKRAARALRHHLKCGVERWLTRFQNSAGSEELNPVSYLELITTASMPPASDQHAGGRAQAAITA